MTCLKLSISNLIYISWFIIWNFRMVANDALCFILSTYDKEVINSNSRLIEEKLLSYASENDPTQGYYFISFKMCIASSAWYENTQHFFFQLRRKSNKYGDWLISLKDSYLKQEDFFRYQCKEDNLHPLSRCSQWRCLQHARVLYFPVSKVSALTQWKKYSALFYGSARCTSDLLGRKKQRGT